MPFLLFNLLLLVIIIFLLIILSWVWPPDSPWAPWWKTDEKTARAMCKLAKIGKKDIVYELGSGDGTALSVIVSEFKANGVGVEIDPLRFYISKVRIHLKGIENKVKLIRGNFFKQDISKATVIFVYLVPKAFSRLKPKFLRELKPGTRIISLRYEMDLPLAKKDKNHKLFLYTIPR